MHGAVKSAAPVGIRVGKGSTRLNGTHSEGCHHVKAKQLTAHQTLPALQFLTQYVAWQGAADTKLPLSGSLSCPSLCSNQVSLCKVTADFPGNSLFSVS